MKIVHVPNGVVIDGKFFKDEPDSIRRCSEEDRIARQKVMRFEIDKIRKALGTTIKP